MPFHYEEFSEHHSCIDVEKAVSPFILDCRMCSTLKMAELLCKGDFGMSFTFGVSCTAIQQVVRAMQRP